MIVMGLTKPSGPKYRRASERSHNAGPMLLFLGSRVRRVVGDMVTESCQGCKPLRHAVYHVARAFCCSSRARSLVSHPNKTGNRVLCKRIS